MILVPLMMHHQHLCMQHWRIKVQQQSWQEQQQQARTAAQALTTGLALLTMHRRRRQQQSRQQRRTLQQCTSLAVLAAMSVPKLSCSRSRQAAGAKRAMRLHSLSTAASAAPAHHCSTFQPRSLRLQQQRCSESCSLGAPPQVAAAAAAQHRRLPAGWQRCSQRLWRRCQPRPAPAPALPCRLPGRRRC